MPAHSPADARATFLLSEAARMLTRAITVPCSPCLSPAPNSCDACPWTSAHAALVAAADQLEAARELHTAYTRARQQSASTEAPDG